MNEKIKAELLEKASRGMIECPAARRIAERLGVPYGRVGKTADELGIKIINCELGCFRR